MKKSPSTGQKTPIKVQKWKKVKISNFGLKDLLFYGDVLVFVTNKPHCIDFRFMRSSKHFSCNYLIHLRMMLQRSAVVVLVLGTGTNMGRPNNVLEEYELFEQEYVELYVFVLIKKGNISALNLDSQTINYTNNYFKVNKHDFYLSCSWQRSRKDGG